MTLKHASDIIFFALSDVPKYWLTLPFGSTKAKIIFKQHFFLTFVVMIVVAAINGCQ